MEQDKSQELKWLVRNTRQASRVSCGHVFFPALKYEKLVCIISNTLILFDNLNKEMKAKECKASYKRKTCLHILKRFRISSKPLLSTTTLSHHASYKLYSLGDRRSKLSQHDTSLFNKNLRQLFNIKNKKKN